jgi:MoaA/NifB/PqqE/SkfB family radical SAM enzyme
MLVPELPRDPKVRDLTLALNYGCNSRCKFCFIEPEIAHGYPETPRELVEEVFRKNARSESFERIIFSGAEATLRKDLPELVAGARERGGFRHVRMQTNGRRLKDRAYCQTLVSAGLGELFVSMHAPTAELDAEVTGSRQGFAQMRAGVANALELGARVISNTCVTRDNHRQLPDLARFLLGEGVRESQLWAFVEFGDIGQSHQHVPFPEVMPYLHEAVAILREGGSSVSLSWFPQCMLGPHADLADNHRAFTLILDEFSKRMHENADFGCVHAERCSRFADSCIGLHERYRACFGDEREQLRPFDGEKKLLGPSALGRSRPGR